MSIEPEHNSYIALIGAYERDNFGDILFLRVCKKLLEPWPLVPLSLVSSNMHNEGGGTIVSASAWFDCCKEDLLPKAIIVAGGEVLTCSVSDALSCDIDPKRKHSFDNTDQASKKRLVEIISWRASELAYVPDLKKLLDNPKQMPPFALNSVGGINLEPRSRNFLASQFAVAQAKYVSVRDAVTQQKITSVENAERPEVELTPDVVSTLKITCANEVETGFVNALSLNAWLAEPYLLFQANDEYIRQNHPQRIGEIIAKTASSQNLSVVFQPAGAATAHDSFAMLDELAQITKEQSGRNLHIYTQRSRDVWTQVAVIAHAACFVGTSLHGRIVASAYGRPRVSLKNEKVSKYASTWEEADLQPFDVSIEELQESVEKATNTPPSRLLAHANKQADLALAGFRTLQASLDLLESTEDNTKINEKIKFFTELALLQECETLRKAVLDLGYELSKEQNSKRLVEQQLSKVQKSKQLVEQQLSTLLDSSSWRLTKPVRAVRKLLTSLKKSSIAHDSKSRT